MTSSASERTPTLQLICQELPSDAWIFPSQHDRRNGQTRRHLSPRTLQRWVATATELAGVAKRLTLHSFRHASATHLLENGTDIRFIQKLLGHQRLETTTIYTHVAQLKSTNVVSPMDRLINPLPNANNNTSTKPKPPVGKLRILMTPNDDAQFANVVLQILNAAEDQQIVTLDAIQVRLDDRHWVRLELPLAESWQQKIETLPQHQRERINSPEFFETIRRHISQRFLSTISKHRFR